jgi:hypothetical protein
MANHTGEACRFLRHGNRLAVASRRVGPQFALISLHKLPSNVPENRAAGEKRVTENEVLAFVQESIPTVGALDLLLVLMRDHARQRSAADLVREMHASDIAIRTAAAALKKAGLIAGDGEYQFAPSSPELRELSMSLEALYGLKPAAVVTAIYMAPNPNLRTFADSFKLKD